MAHEIDATFWRGRRVLLTGHSGFQGGWLTLWLLEMGAEVTGYSLPPPAEPSLFTDARISERISSVIGDIRDFGQLSRVVAEARPQTVFHLAAQALVRRSYQDPIETYGTNLLGTVHLLEAVRRVAGVEQVINITTDKVYENREWDWGYREDDRLGGYDPYSASKACAEIATASHRRAYSAPDAAAIATARAGNVIGGGDWATDRLIPDLVAAFKEGRSALLRNPNAIRPWQHVLDALSGYLLLAQRLATDPRAYAQAWNFGPAQEAEQTVGWIADRLAKRWGSGAGWHRDEASHPHEARFLKLDSAKARERLGWRPRWNIDTALARTVDWYAAVVRGADARDVTLAQLKDYAAAGSTAGE